MPTAIARRPTRALIITIDMILVVVFCIIGRLSHSEGIFGDLPGLLDTIWPFLLAALVAHIVALVAGMRAERVLVGTVVWGITVIVGLALRALSGQGTAVPFVIVATLTLALFLLGWRVVVAAVRRLRGRARS